MMLDMVRTLITFLKSLPHPQPSYHYTYMILALCLHGFILSERCTRIDHYYPRFFFLSLSLLHRYLSLKIEGVKIRTSFKFKVQPG